MIDLVRSPVLVARKTMPYNRIMIALAELPFHTAAAQMAIDLVRMIGAKLFLGVVQQPDIVVGSDHRQEMTEQHRELEALISMYHIKSETVIMEGNPIREIEKRSRDFDLLILPRKRGRRGSIRKPDVGLNLIHRAHCSVMVMPY